MSIMAHRVKVLPGRTFRVCPATTIPYNADFDGDEMNIHVPQTEEARSEAEFLLEVTNHIISPRHGNPIIAPTEDYITGMYILTKKETKFTIGEAMDILSLCGIEMDRSKIPKKKEGGKEYVYGKDIFSLILPEDINLSLKTKLCSCTKCTKDTCPTEGHVEIKNGKLLYGAVEKKAIYELESIIYQKHGNERAAKFIDDIALISSYVISRKGFTISLDDYRISEELERKIKEADEKARKEANLLITQFKNKTLERDPGKSLKETLEGRLMRIFSNVRSEIEKLIETELTAKVPSIFLAKIGARGSMLNVEQISGVLSQQSVRGKRLRRGFTKRITAHFERGDIGPLAKGYITSNFYKGLDPVEYFFQACGGRDSLINTAIGTARSGYLQRRLIYALQDLITDEDLKVIDQSGNVIQFMYGGDGIDPMKGKNIAEESAITERE
jgi:DNA-directed RNA polymerase subunit A'